MNGRKPLREMLRGARLGMQRAGCVGGERGEAEAGTRFITDHRDVTLYRKPPMPLPPKPQGKRAHLSRRLCVQELFDYRTHQN
jgi:hypothetical protein